MRSTTFHSMVSSSTYVPVVRRSDTITAVAAAVPTTSAPQPCRSVAPASSAPAITIHLLFISPLRGARCHDFTQAVDDEQVHFLHAHRALMRHVQVEVSRTAHAAHGAPVAPGEGDDLELARLCGLHRLD